LGGVLAYFATRATAVLKVKALSYALMALSGLVTIFAFGYALDALYTALLFRFGALNASLLIAGGLLLPAACCLVAARMVAKKPTTAPTPLNIRYELFMLQRTKLPALAAGAGVAVVAVVAAAIVGRRRRSDAGELDNGSLQRSPIRRDK